VPQSAKTCSEQLSRNKDLSELSIKLYGAECNQKTAGRAARRLKSLIRMLTKRSVYAAPAKACWLSSNQLRIDRRSMPMIDMLRKTKRTETKK